MKKWVSLLLAGTMVGSLLTGCGGGGTEQTTAAGNTKAEATTAEKVVTSEAEKTDSQEEITLTIWHSFTQEDRGAAVQKMADEFTKIHPNVKFEIEVFPWSTFDTKWKTGLSAGELPDISTALPEGIMMMAESDALAPLDDMIDDMGNPFIEKPFEALRFNGKTLAVPYYAHARALWYRTDVLEKYGLTPPETLDDLMNAAKAIADGGDMYGMAVPMSKKDFYGTIYLYIVSKGMGGNILTEEGRCDLTSPTMIKAIQYLVDLYKNASPEGSINYGDPETNDSFVQGKAAFYFESGFAIDRVNKGNPEIADKFAALAPPSETGTPGWFADYISMVVWKQSKNQEMAKEFIKFMYDEQHYSDFLHLVPGGMLPTIQSLYDEESAFWDNDVIQAHKADVEVIKEGITNGCPVANDFGPNPSTNIIKTQGIIEEMLQNITMGSMSVEEAAKRAEDTINSEITNLKNQ